MAAEPVEAGLFELQQWVLIVIRCWPFQVLVAEPNQHNDLDVKNFVQIQNLLRCQNSESFYKFNQVFSISVRLNFKIN